MKSVLVGFIVCCLQREVEEEQLQIIIFEHGETETKPVRLWKIPGFPPNKRLAGTTNTIPPSDHQAFNLIHIGIYEYSSFTILSCLEEHETPNH